MEAQIELNHLKSIDSNAVAHAEARPDWIRDDLFPYRSRFLEVDGARLHYVDEGTGPVVLMLHGSPLWSFMYRDMIAALKGRYRCVAVDLPGMGLSRAPLFEGQAFAHNADWLQGFVRALDLRDMTVVVHATSGPSALSMATREPDRVSRLVISHSFAWSLTDVPELRRIVRIVSSRLFGFLTVHLNFLARITARKARRAGSFSAEERLAILGPYREKTTRRHLRNILYSVRVESAWLERLEADLSCLRHVPTLLVYGAHDNGYKAGFLERWQQLLPHSRAVLLADAGHFPLEDDSAEVIDAVADWMPATVAP